MKMKKILAVLLTLCLFVFAFTACNSEPPTSTIPTPPEQGVPAEPSKPSDNDEQIKPLIPSEPTTPIVPEQPEQPSEPETPVNPPVAETEKAYEISADGKTVYFGSYPATQVTDDSVISALTRIAGNPLSSDKWNSYGYYIGGEAQDFMRYADIQYNSVKYRGVHFTSYRPYYTTIESSEQRSYQDNNGYAVDTIYWFAYETLSWRVLSKTDGTALLVSDSIIDSREYYPQSKGTNGNAANNYAMSAVRSFLNDSFYNTAFSDKQKTNIVSTEVDNGASSTGFDSNKYAVQNTTDNVFLLSYADVVNAEYGFNTDENRKLDATDYAKAQGLRTDGGARWWLRSPNNRYDFYARYVDGYGYAEYNQYVYWSHLGIVPALTIKLFDESKQEPNEPNTGAKVLIAYFSRMGEGRYGDRYTYHFATHLNDYIKNSTLFEIEPVVPYPVDFTGAQDRASQEWSSNARPAIKTQVKNIDEYDVIFIGYPIWNGNAPRIIYTFLDEYDLSDKQVYLFATSSSSSMSGSVSGLKSTYTQIDFLSYLRVTSSSVTTTSGITEIQRWVDSLSLSV